LRTRKSLLSAFSSIALVLVVVVAIMIDKPDYGFFNFLYRNSVPAAEIIGQGITYPARLIGHISERYRKSKIIQREHEKMADELESLRRVTAENEILTAENARLRRKLGMAESQKYPAVAADIKRDNSFFGKQSFIVMGDVAAGSVVISNDGYFLGMVEQASGGFAKIRSAEDAGSNIPVRIAGTDVFGFLTGGGNKDPQLRFLSDGDHAPDIGMVLVTSGVNGNVPSGIPVGKVKDVKGAEISVALGAELKNQESVMVLSFGKNGRYD